MEFTISWYKNNVKRDQFNFYDLGSFRQMVVNISELHSPDRIALFVRFKLSGKIRHVKTLTHQQDG